MLTEIFFPSSMDSATKPPRVCAFSSYRPGFPEIDKTLSNSIFFNCGGQISNLCPNIQNYLSCFFDLGKAHAIVHIDLPFGDVGQFSLDQTLFQGGKFIGEQNSFDMVVFVLDHSGGETGEGPGVLFKILVEKLDGDVRLSEYIFPDVRNAEAAFIKGPFITFFVEDPGVDEYLF